jgi:hypothetical protein
MTKLRSIPKKAIIQVGTDPVADPLNAVLKQVVNGEQYPHLYILIDDEHVAGVDFATITGMPPGFHGTCFWADDTTDLTAIRYHKPRYDNLRDAAIVSLQRHPEAAFVSMRDSPGFAYPLAFKVRSFFDDPYDVREGATEKWWNRYIKNLRPQTSPVHWRGSDDPMG